MMVPSNGSWLFEQVPHKSMREMACSAIRQAILSGRLKPGDRLLEAEIAHQMGISRAPVREAVRQLVSEGLVVSYPHRGTFVAELSAEDLWEIYTLRAAIESLAVRLVAEQATPEIVCMLRQAVADMAQAAQEGDLQHLANLDIAFHEMLCRLSGHSRLLETWLGMIVQIRIFIDLTHALYRPVEDMVRLHADIVGYIENRQAREASEALTQHILDAGQRIYQERQSRGEGDSREETNQQP